MAVSVSIAFNGSGGIDASWSGGNCAPLSFYNVILLKDGDVFATFSDNPPSGGTTFNNVGEGAFIVNVAAFSQDIFTGDFFQCDLGQSNTLTRFCIPSNATDVSMRRLSRFYNVPISNIQLSGPNNPSTSGSIFGNSDLPNTGNPSKTRPNAISELRGRCGGVVPWDLTGDVSGLMKNTAFTANGRLSIMFIYQQNGTSLITGGSILSQICVTGYRNLSQIRPVTSTIQVSLQSVYQSPSALEAFSPEWTFRIYTDATRSTLVHSSGGTISPNSNLNTAFSVTGLTANAGYFFEYIVESIDCSVT